MTTITKTCENPACGKEFQALQKQVKLNKARFCTHACWYAYNADNKPVYNAATIEKIKALWGTMKIADVADQIGVSAESLRQNVYKLKQAGHDFPDLKELARKRREEIKSAPKPPKPRKPKSKPKRRVPPNVRPKPVSKESSKRKVNDDLPNMLRLKGSQKIHIAEHSRQVEKVIKVDHRTYIIKHKQTA
jgi:hypothetical protein